MKYQNFAIIFVIILLPLSMVLSYYIQLQAETITLQSKYQNKLNDSTYDAIAAYQMNSLNTQRVTGESVKSYVLASVNTFFTTLATNLGMSSASKQYLLPYVPAILFTTYDGYYIYSPLKMEKVAEDPETGIGVQTKDGDIIYVHKNAPKDFKPSAVDCENLRNTEFGNNVTGNYTNNKNDAKIEYNYMLKPFIYYSAQYKQGSKYDFVASYTLDNYITLYGTRDRNYTADSAISGATDDFSKSGYLIDTDPSKITLSGNILLKGVTRNGDISTSEPSENGRATYTAAIKANRDGGTTQNHVRYRAIDINSDEAYRFINYYYYGEDTNDGGYYPSRVTTLMPNPIRYQTGDDIIEATLDIEEQINSDNYPEMTTGNVGSYLLSSGGYTPITVTYNGETITDRQAKEYYVKAYFFSKWVSKNLGDTGVRVTASSIIQNEDIIKDEVGDTKIEYTDFANDETKIFDINGTDNNPERTTSYLSEHKRAVIKNSIQFNLNTAISTYDASYYGGEVSTEFRLPILTTKDWESILNNVSMTSFMQGLPCGLTKFNNYAVVKSNNNNTSASLENIYFTKSIGTTSQSSSYYHKYDCAKLANDDGILSTDYYLSDLSAEFKYDAKKINIRIRAVDDERVVCLFDDSTNSYYSIDPDKTASNVDVLAIGEKIDSGDIRSYGGPIYKKETTGEWVQDGSVSGLDLTALPNSSDVLYIYDHQNLGCYDCIVSGEYTPVVRMYDGELRRVFLTDRGEGLTAVEDGATTTFYYEDGRKFDGTPTPYSGTAGYLIDPIELQLRKKSIYTAIAKHRNSLYKTNDYVNR